MTIRDLTLDGNLFSSQLGGSDNYRAGILVAGASAQIGGETIDSVTVEKRLSPRHPDFAFRRGGQPERHDRKLHGAERYSGPGIVTFDANATITGNTVAFIGSSDSSDATGIEVLDWQAPLGTGVQATIQGNTITGVAFGGTGIQVLAPAAGSLIGGAGSLGNTIAMTGSGRPSASSSATCPPT